MARNRLIRFTLRAAARGNFVRGQSVTMRPEDPRVKAWKADPAWTWTEVQGANPEDPKPVSQRANELYGIFVQWQHEQAARIERATPEEQRQYHAMIRENLPRIGPQIRRVLGLLLRDDPQPIPAPLPVEPPTVDPGEEPDPLDEAEPEEIPEEVLPPSDQPPLDGGPADPFADLRAAVGNPDEFTIPQFRALAARVGIVIPSKAKTKAGIIDSIVELAGSKLLSS